MEDTPQNAAGLALVVSIFWFPLFLVACLGWVCDKIGKAVDRS